LPQKKKKKKKKICERGGGYEFSYVFIRERKPV